MKNLMKCFSAVLMLTLILAGCSDKEVEKKKEELSKIEETVVKNLQDIDSYAKEDIEEATSFIEKNIDKVKDGDIAKKVAEYGYYLENAAKSGSENITHDLADLGKTASEAGKSLYSC